MTSADWSSLPSDLLWKLSTTITILSPTTFDSGQFANRGGHQLRRPQPTSHASFPGYCYHRATTPTAPMKKMKIMKLMTRLFPTTLSHLLTFATEKKHEISLQEPFRTSWRWRGSSHGWLVLLDRSPIVTILNPVTGATRYLPRVSALPQVKHFDGSEYDLDPEYTGPWMNCNLRVMRNLVIKKFILSDCPNRSLNFTALAIFYPDHGTSNLACCRYGQLRWTLVPGTRFIEDAVYIDGMVYAVDLAGHIFKVDVSCDPPKLVEEIEVEGFHDYGNNLYLMLADNKLIIVSRFIDCFALRLDGEYLTRSFRVYGLNWSEKKWKRVRNLGDLALFVGGYSSSSAVTASDFPGCRENAIYFLDDDGQMEYPGGLPEKHDMGIFCLKDESFSPVSHDHRYSRPNPIWLTPSLL